MSAASDERFVDAGVLRVAYMEHGDPAGRPVVLLHGFPYDVHAYDGVAPLLAAQGLRVVVPHLRGYGPTRFLSDETPRSGQQAALGADLLALLDALHIDRANADGVSTGGTPKPGQFTGRHEHRLVAGGIGHNLPQEAPQAFARAVCDVDGWAG